LQIGQAENVEHAGGVLGDAHGPDDRHGFVHGEELGRTLEVLDGDPGDLGHQRRRIAIDRAADVVKPLRTRLDKGLIVPAPLQDDVHQAVEQGHIGAGPLAEVQRGELGDVDGPGIGDHELDAAREHGLADHGAKDRVLLGGVGTDDEEGLGLFDDVVHRIAHGARAQAHAQAGHGRGVTQTRAMIDIMGAEHLAGELLHQVILFIGALCGGEDPDGIRSRFLTHLHQLAGDNVQRRIPVHRDPLPAPFARPALSPVEEV
jgi:hypothetical protein